MTQQISKAVLAVRLDAVLGANVGMNGLGILIYGWTRKNPQLRVNISHRSWLYDYEVQSLSEYAGYDLLQTESNSICE